MRTRELCSALAGLSSADLLDQIRVFKTVDKDGSGELEYLEISKEIKKAGRYPPPPKPDPPAPALDADGCTERCTDSYAYRCADRCADGRTDRCADSFTDRCAYRCTD